MESKDKREGWLRKLKVGDEVAIISHFREYSINRIAKITPTGRITVGNTTFDYNGSERNTGTYSISDSLREVTQEIRDAIRKYQLIYKLKKVNWNTIPLETLETLIKLIK